MNLDNLFDLLVAVVFSMSPQIGVIRPKHQDLLVYYLLGEVETLSQSYQRKLQGTSKLSLLNNKTQQTTNLVGKYTTEISILKHLQHRITTFEREYIIF